MWIDVNYCDKLTDKSIHAIGCNCKLLSSINVDGCRQLTDDGLVALAKGCQQLKSIDFSKTNLSQLPDQIGYLELLSHLRVDDNKIRNLPRSIANLPPDCFLSLQNNPLQYPPMPIAEKGIEAIARYFSMVVPPSVDSSR
jgi:Leucine-rich repeat (LRR) protein